MIKFKAEVDAAKAKEMKAWDALGACAFEPLGDANNNIKSRWVLRWKADDKGGRKVKARLVVKGF